MQLAIPMQRSMLALALAASVASGCAASTGGRAMQGTLVAAGSLFVIGGSIDHTVANLSSSEQASDRMLDAPHGSELVLVGCALYAAAVAIGVIDRKPAPEPE